MADQRVPSSGTGMVVDRTAILEALRVAVIVTDLTGTILECNSEAEFFYGVDRSTLIGLSSQQFAAGPISAELRDEIGRHLTAGETWEGDFIIRRGDGSRIVVHAVDSPIFEGTDLVGVASASIDITQRWHAERRLAAQHSINGTLAGATTLEEAVPQILRDIGGALGWSASGFWEPDPLTNTLRCTYFWTETPELNAFAAASHELALARGVGLPGRVWESGAALWLRDAATDPNFPRAADAERSGLHHALAVPVGGRDETLAVWEFFGTDTAPNDPDMLSVVESLGTQVGLLIRRRRAETAARASDDLRAGIVRASLDAIVAMNHVGEIVEFSPAAESIFGYRRHEAVGQSLAHVMVPPALRDLHHAGLARYLETGVGPILDQRIEIDAVDRRGRIFPVELTVSRIPASDPPIFTAYVRDITERKRTEQALDESRERITAIAETLQANLLPPELPEIAGIDLASYYLPAGTGYEVGGDFYDVFQRARDDWILTIGDVCGKGPDAAVVTALARHTIRAAAIEHTRPRAMLAILNQALLRSDPARTCTAIVARLRSSKGRTQLSFSTAGHLLPKHLRADATVADSGEYGMLLGATTDAEYTDHRIELRDGETIVFYTDGVTEARSGSEFFGDERLDGILRAVAGEPVVVVTARVAEAVARFQTGPSRDDIAILAVQRRR